VQGAGSVRARRSVRFSGAQIGFDCRGQGPERTFPFSRAHTHRTKIVLFPHCPSDAGAAMAQRRRVAVARRRAAEDDVVGIVQPRSA